MEQVRKVGAGFTLISCERLKIDKPALGVNVSSIRPNGMSGEWGVVKVLETISKVMLTG
jgi:hypothetical protein